MPVNLLCFALGSKQRGHCIFIRCLLCGQLAAHSLAPLHILSFRIKLLACWWAGKPSMFLFGGLVDLYLGRFVVSLILILFILCGNFCFILLIRVLLNWDVLPLVRILNRFNVVKSRLLNNSPKFCTLAQILVDKGVVWSNLIKKFVVKTAAGWRKDACEV